MENIIAPFTSGLLTGLREGVEAALIVGIIAGYLVKIGRGDRLFVIWTGVGLAVLASALIGAGIFATFGALEGAAEKAFEATAMLVASAVVTWMLFWMRRQAASLSGELREGIDRALVSAPLLGLGGLAFTAVIREGIETSLFLIGQAAAVASNGAGAWVFFGAIVGLAIANRYLILIAGLADHVITAAVEIHRQGPVFRTVVNRNVDQIADCLRLRRQDSQANSQTTSQNELIEPHAGLPQLDITSMSTLQTEDRPDRG